MNWLVKDTDRLSGTIHEAFHVATTGRPGPVLVDIPKDVQFATGTYVTEKPAAKATTTSRAVKGDTEAIEALVEAMETAERPVFYTGGGVINSGPEASSCCANWSRPRAFPITSTLMGLGAYPASGENWLGMLGMHGTLRGQPGHAWLRPDDQYRRALRRPDHRPHRRFLARAPQGHIDIDPSSINKVIHADFPIIGDVAMCWRTCCASGRRAAQDQLRGRADLVGADRGLARGRLPALHELRTTIKPQYALERLEALTKDHDRYICTEVGQHQMWAAQFLGFEDPNRWMTSGGLGTMGYGVPASIGVQIAHPDALVINVAGEASWLMNMQEMGTAVQYRLPVKQFILNNERLGMVRQWQELLHGERYSHSWSEALPDFVKLAEAFGCKGIMVQRPRRSRRRDHGDAGL
jgi:acetolactate synthase-1/2/3 large subunit